MAGVTKSYLLPIEDLTLDERLAIRASVQQLLENAAAQLAIRLNPNDLIIRDMLPNTDVGLAATDDWLIAGAGVAGTPLQYFSAAVPQDRIYAFYGISVESAAASISTIRLTLGATSITTRGVYQLEELYSRLQISGYFSSPVLFTRTETVRAMVTPRLAFAAGSERLAFLARVIEPIGQVVSAPSM